MVPILTFAEKMVWCVSSPSAAKGNVIPPAMMTHTMCGYEKNKLVLFGGYDGAQEFSEVSFMTISDDGCKCSNDHVKLCFPSILHKSKEI